ncbi:MAG TPA: ATPase [Bacteroidales bacterium]|nr:ATPase [Bacteroidales bacterium]
MILIADSGSTKTEWRLTGNGITGKSVFSAGINPYFINTDEILNLLEKEIKEIKSTKPETIWFYGTGCNSESKNDSVSLALESFFSTKEIKIGSDLLGAARSLCMNKPGIACIMGTGSNSCYYDGSSIVSNVAPLGYILGDEGGAAVLGRKLLTGVLKNQVPPAIAALFFETYKITRAEILENVYMKPFPNRFLGQFAKFISANIGVPELRYIVDSSFDEFIVRNVNQYPEAKSLPVNFTGSVAYHFRACLEERLRKNNLIPGKIILSPMEDLVNYHLEYPNL